MDNKKHLNKNISELKRKYTKNHSLHPIIEREINRDIVSSLLPILESWSGQKLSNNVTVHGRRYLRGASMLMHTDNKNSHLFGGILQVR